MNFSVIWDQGKCQIGVYALFNLSILHSFILRNPSNMLLPEHTSLLIQRDLINLSWENPEYDIIFVC